MNYGAEKIKSFTDLNTWKEGHKLVLMIYEITKKFLKEEFDKIIEQAITVNKITNGLIKKSKSIIHDS